MSRPEIELVDILWFSDFNIKALDLLANSPPLLRVLFSDFKKVMIAVEADVIYRPST